MQEMWCSASFSNSVSVGGIGTKFYVQLKIWLSGQFLSNLLPPSIHDASGIKNSFAMWIKDNGNGNASDKFKLISVTMIQLVIYQLASCLVVGNVSGLNLNGA